MPADLVQQVVQEVVLVPVPAVSTLTTLEISLVVACVAFAAVTRTVTLWVLRDKLRPHCMREKPRRNRRTQIPLYRMNRTDSYENESDTNERSTPAHRENPGFMEWMMRRQNSQMSDITVSGTQETFRTTVETLNGDFTDRELGSPDSRILGAANSVAESTELPYASEDAKQKEKGFCVFPWKSTFFKNTNYSF